MALFPMSSTLSPLNVDLTIAQTQAVTLGQGSLTDSTPDLTALISGPAIFLMSLFLLSAMIAVLVELRAERKDS